MSKILYFKRLSIKCISCRICGFQKNCDLLTYRQTDKQIHRGAPLLKKIEKYFCHIKPGSKLRKIYIYIC